MASNKINDLKKSPKGADVFSVSADEAFDMMDMDGNGTIEKGDIEYGKRSKKPQDPPIFTWKKMSQKA